MSLMIGSPNRVFGRFGSLDSGLPNTMAAFRLVFWKGEINP